MHATGIHLYIYEYQLSGVCGSVKIAADLAARPMTINSNGLLSKYTYIYSIRNSYWTKFFDRRIFPIEFSEQTKQCIARYSSNGTHKSFRISCVWTFVMIKRDYVHLIEPLHNERTQLHMVVGGRIGKNAQKWNISSPRVSAVVYHHKSSGTWPFYVFLLSHWESFTKSSTHTDILSSSLIEDKLSLDNRPMTEFLYFYQRTDRTEWSFLDTCQISIGAAQPLVPI